MSKPKNPFDQYEIRMPAAQNAIDVVNGWVSAFPDRYGVQAGAAGLFGDQRVQAAIESFGGTVEGKHVLELGPLEGAHTLAFTEAGAVVDAIEANKNAFLRCLITKEITAMRNARFHLGDALTWLENNPTRYDLIFASGVLYHMREPVRLLQAIAERTDAVFIWTHFVDIDAISDPTIRKNWLAVQDLQPYRGEKIRLYGRSYVEANKTPEFSGGAFDDHRWMARDDILKVLSLAGMSDVRVLSEASNDFGPHFCLFAKRHR